MSVETEDNQESGRHSVAVNVSTALTALVILIFSQQPAFATPPHRPWVNGIFREQGILLTFQHPPSWKVRLPAQNLHYQTTFAFIANFGLNPDWCMVHDGGNGFTCLSKNLGTFPKNGVLMTFGVNAPHPGSGNQTNGRVVRVSGRSARQDGPFGGCGLGTGGTSQMNYAVPLSGNQGQFFVDFCFSGPNSGSLEHQAEKVVETMKLNGVFNSKLLQY
jgi:hypothetical protein